MYYAKNDAGEIDLSKPFVTQSDKSCSNVKVKQWKGQWQEGIISTVSQILCNTAAKEGSWLGVLNPISDCKSIMELWNCEDENLRTAYRSNMKHLALDLFFLAFGGMFITGLLSDWDDEYAKAHREDKGDMGKAMSATAA